MPSWVLWVALASAAETPPAPTAEAEPTVAEVDPVDASRPWEQYRLRPILHPTVDTEFLALWEPAFLKRNRQAGIGATLGIVGTTAAFGGALFMWTGSPVAAATFGSGLILGVTGPILGITGTLSAARILRAGGVRVPRGWSYAAAICLGVSSFGLPTIVSYPAALVLPVLQSGINRSAFHDAMGRAPGRAVTINLIPTRHGDQTGLALAGTW